MQDKLKLNAGDPEGGAQPHNHPTWEKSTVILSKKYQIFSNGDGKLEKGVLIPLIANRRNRKTPSCSLSNKNKTKQSGLHFS